MEQSIRSRYSRLVKTRSLQILGQNEQQEAQVCRHIEAASGVNIGYTDVATTSRNMRILTTELMSCPAIKAGAEEWLEAIITIARLMLLLIDG